MSGNGDTNIWKSAIAQGALGVALGLIPIGRLRGLGKLAFILGPSAAVAAGGSAIAKNLDDAEAAANLAQVSLAGAGALAAGQWVSVKVDHGMEQALVRRGVKRPRLAIALLSGLATAAVAVVDRKTRGRRVAGS